MKPILATFTITLLILHFQMNRICIVLVQLGFFTMDTNWMADPEFSVDHTTLLNKPSQVTTTICIKETTDAIQSPKNQEPT